jgi:hypothetical protein
VSYTKPPVGSNSIVRKCNGKNVWPMMKSEINFFVHISMAENPKGKQEKPARLDLFKKLGTRRESKEIYV